MSDSSRIATTAALLGDPARANMLAALMDGRALTAKELAFAAHVTPQTASGHLAKLSDGGLLEAEKQGRHRYYRLASPLVGQMLEGIMAVAGAQTRIGARPLRPTRIEDEMRMARTCYDHIAGRLGVALADRLTGEGHVAFLPDGGEVTPAGLDFLSGFGISLADPRPTRRVFCRPCLDWSERRTHIAGKVGARLCEHFLKQGWVRQRANTRALEITPPGRAGFMARFGIDLWASEPVS